MFLQSILVKNIPEWISIFLLIALQYQNQLRMLLFKFPGQVIKNRIRSIKSTQNRMYSCSNILVFDKPADRNGTAAMKQINMASTPAME